MIHEPECTFSNPDDVRWHKDDCICEQLTIAYQRGREDAAKAMFAEWHTPHEFGVDVLALMYAAARGEGLTGNASSSDLDADEIRIKECEHRFVMHYADKAGQCDKCGAIDTEVWHEGGIIEQMYDEANTDSEQE